MIRIGINALYLIPGGVGGTEIYLRNVLEALGQVDTENHYFVFRNRETGSDLVPRSPNFHDCPQPVRASSRPLRMLYEQVVFPLVCARAGLDVLFNAGFTVPLFYRGPMITVFHDLQYKRHPEFFRWFDLPFWRLMLPVSAARSRRIVVLSNAVRGDVVNFYRYPAARVRVIPHGVEPRFAQIAAERARDSPDRKTILTVSTLHPHKNLDTLLSAFQRFLQHNPGWQLIAVGLKGFETANIERRRRELRLESAVTITGWIPREELYGLFATAAAFVYPSQFEGFGIPVLEALSAALPVACSRLPSLIEIAGEAARFFDPLDVDDIAEALADVTSNAALRTQLQEAALRRAQAFSWIQSAHDLVSVFYETTRSKKAHD